MKLNFNFDAKTFLSKYWPIAKSNFQTIQDEHNTLSDKLDTEITQRTNADVGLADKITAETKARESADSSLNSSINNEATVRQANDNALQRNIDAEAENRQTGDNELQRNIDSETTDRQAADGELNGKKADKTELYGTDETTTHTVTYSLTAADVVVSIDTAHDTGTVTVAGNTVKSKILLDGYSIQAAELSATFSCGKGENGDKYICIYYSPDTGTLTMTIEDVETAPEAGTIALMTVGYNTATVTTMYNRAQTFTGINNLNGLKTTNKNSFLAAVNEIFATAKTASDTANTAQKNANDAVVDTSTLQGEFDEHEQSQNNPHNVTAEQVGLGDVPNVTTNNQKPTFTEATNRSNIVSGETISVLFGKIKKFFTDLKTVAFTGSYTDLSNKPTTATTSASGLMSSSDKTKLNGIATGANNYTHPATHAASMIVQDSTHRFVSDNEISDWDSKLGAQDEIYDGWTLWDVAESVSDFSSAFNTNQFAGAGEIVEKLADAMRSATIVVGASNSKYHSDYIHAVDYECTGTNDQTKIQQAIDALPATGGKIVLLEGTYNISGTITIKKQNVTLQGLGRNVILKMATSTSDVNMFDISGATGLVISDIAIDCANNTGGGSTAIKLYSSDHVIIERVNITNSKGNGVEWFNCNYTRFSDVSFINVRLCVWDRGSNHSSTFGNIVIDTVTNGIVLNASSTLNKIFDCIVRTATESGIKSDAAYTMINDNIVYDCGVGITANGNCSTVSGNNARNNDTGISVNGKMVNVSGNTALRADGSGNVSSYSSSQYTILMGSSSANCLVIGNIISGKNYTNNGASTNTFANNKY